MGECHACYMHIANWRYWGIKQQICRLRRGGCARRVTSAGANSSILSLFGLMSAPFTAEQNRDGGTRRPDGKLEGTLSNARGDPTAAFVGVCSLALSGGLLLIFCTAVCCVVAGKDFTESTVGEFVFEQAALLERAARMPFVASCVLLSVGSTVVRFCFDWIICIFNSFVRSVRFFLVDQASSFNELFIEYARWCPWPILLVHGAIWLLVFNFVLRLFDCGLGDVYYLVKVYLTELSSNEGFRVDGRDGCMPQSHSEFPDASPPSTSHQQDVAGPGNMEKHAQEPPRERSFVVGHSEANACGRHDMCGKDQAVSPGHAMFPRASSENDNGSQIKESASVQELPKDQDMPDIVDSSKNEFGSPAHFLKRLLSSSLVANFKQKIHPRINQGTGVDAGAGSALPHYQSNRNGDKKGETEAHLPPSSAEQESRLTGICSEADNKMKGLSPELPKGPPHDKCTRPVDDEWEPFDAESDWCILSKVVSETAAKSCL